MAKPKRSVVVERSHATRRLLIYCDHYVEQAGEVRSVEGVSVVTIWEDCLWAYVDPRYDLDEVADEIEAMLAPVEIPEAFLDGSFDAIDSAGQDWTRHG